MTMTAVIIDCATPSTTAIRNSARLRARLPTASERAMNVVIALSRPRTPILLMMSVVDHATENMPSATGPSSRATRNEKMPRKFDSQHRDRVQERAAFQLDSCLVNPRRCVLTGGATSSAAFAAFMTFREAGS